MPSFSFILKTEGFWGYRDCCGEFFCKVGALMLRPWFFCGILNYAYNQEAVWVQGLLLRVQGLGLFRV